MTSRPFNSAILPRESRVHAVAPSFGLELRPVDVRDASDIEHAITSFAPSSNDGLIVPAPRHCGQEEAPDGACLQMGVGAVFLH
jgi:hypothetical protein